VSCTRITHSKVVQHTFRLYLDRRTTTGREYAWCDVLAQDEVSAVIKAGDALGLPWVVASNPIRVQHVGYCANGTHPMRSLGNGVWRGLPVE